MIRNQSLDCAHGTNKMGNETDLMSLLFRACLSLKSDPSKVRQLESLFNVTVSPPTQNPNNHSDSGAVTYIVVVLVFYSLFIVIMIMKSSHSQKREMEEEQAMDNYFKGMPFGKSMREHYVNKIAIKAFHTLTTSSYNSNKKQNSKPKFSNNIKRLSEKSLLETDV